MLFKQDETGTFFLFFDFFVFGLLNIKTGRYQLVHNLTKKIKFHHVALTPKQ